MKYPAIIRNDNEIEMLLFNEDNAIILSGIHKGEFHDVYPRFRGRYKNITREYLSNTWGVVESKEHAEFIIELTKNCSIRLYSTQNKKAYFCCDGKYLWFTGFEQYALNRNRKQITIPLPPKAVKNEWPQVGDEVEVRHDSGQVLKGELLAITSEYAIIQQLGHEQHLYLSAWKFSKPKTPEEELRDELISEINSAPNSDYAVDVILEKYNVNKKDKGDE
ncbi:hypothetical protein [Pseudoalteromonas phage C7]|uniref:hypothetical protein n=1 Tax=Pseudoalteromonas phage C7 TaxID=2510494 RepID=UPI001019D019|nr:hypothetical protein PP587_gp35 [Pseudoalteromonas phage C7]QAY17989.1 hypothetical protein [Pseudoalteromonas phage C7]